MTGSKSQKAEHHTGEKTNRNERKWRQLHTRALGLPRQIHQELPDARKGDAPAGIRGDSNSGRRFVTADRIFAWVRANDGRKEHWVSTRMREREKELGEQEKRELSRR
jgi:hypothetical protein